MGGYPPTMNFAALKLSAKIASRLNLEANFLKNFPGGILQLPYYFLCTLSLMNQTTVFDSTVFFLFGREKGRKSGLA